MSIIRADIFPCLLHFGCYINVTIIRNDTLAKPLFFLPEIVGTKLTPLLFHYCIRNTCKKIELQIGSKSDHYIV